jgi:lipopolysaccharide export system permease protein
LIFERYLIKEILRPLLLGMGLLIFIFLGFGSARELTLAAKGVIDLNTALQLIGLNTLTQLDILLPSALFFSVLAGLGRLHKDGEILVLAAAGVSPWRILGSVSVLAIGVSLVVGLLSVEGRPWVYRQIYQLEAQAAANFDLKQISAGSFVTLDDTDYVFIAEGLDKDKGLYNNIFLHREYDNGESSEVIFARSAALPDRQMAGQGTAVFNAGRLYHFDHVATEDMIMKYDNFTVILPEMEQKKDTYRRKAEKTENLQRSDSLKDVAEYQWRMSVPLLTVLLCLIAVPLAKARPRQQRFGNVVLAIGVYILVFSVTTIIRTWVEQGTLPPMPGLWISGLLPLAILFLLLRPDRRFQF